MIGLWGLGREPDKMGKCGQDYIWCQGYRWSGCHTAFRIDSICWMDVLFFAHCSRPILLSAENGLLHGKELGSSKGNNCLLAIASPWSLSLTPLSAHTCAKQQSLWASCSPSHCFQMLASSHNTTCTKAWGTYETELCSKAYLPRALAHSLPGLGT